MNKSWTKYLKSKALINRITPEPDQLYQLAVVLPVYAEADFIDATLSSLVPQIKDVLVVAVINHPAHATAEELENNRRVLEKAANYNIACIDAGELRGGVGEARKIGMDSVLPYLKNDSLICCLDGDSPVSENYVSTVSQAFTASPECAGGVVEFCHSESSDPQIEKAITEYEIWLRYYAYSLKSAGSPYAFFTVGSTIVARADAYVKAGGMRIRSAAEDFYFLQALSKIGEIIDVKGATVYPSPRPSFRVPFGTGRKVGEIIDGEEVKLYHPAIFTLLKAMLAQAELCDDFSQLPVIFEQHLALPSREFLHRNNFTANWGKIYRNTAKNDIARLRAFHIWFDAFRTLKFVHFCESEYPEQFNRCEIMNALTVILPGIKFSSKQNALNVLRNLT